MNWDSRTPHHIVATIGMVILLGLLWMAIR